MLVYFRAYVGRDAAATEDPGAFSATSRSVYFPAGCWREPETHATLLGPRSVTVTASLQRLPYYSRCGTSPFAVAGARRPSRTGPNAKPHRPRPRRRAHRPRLPG